MKYIEFSDGHLVAFEASRAHYDVAWVIGSKQPELKPSSAGFLHFTHENPVTFGRSFTMGLDGRKIDDLRQRDFVGGRNKDGWFVLSTCPEKARILLGSEVKPCGWTQLELEEMSVELPLPAGIRPPSFLELGE